MIAEIHNEGPGSGYGKAFVKALVEGIQNHDAAIQLFNDLVPILRQIAADPDNVSLVAQANEHIQQILHLTNHAEEWKARIHKVVNQILPNAP